MLGHEKIPDEKLYHIADEANFEGRSVRVMRNIMLGMTALSEVIIGTVDLAGVDYPSTSIYFMTGGLFLVGAGITHISGNRWDRVAEDFREGARDVQVMNTYAHPEEWDWVIPGPEDWDGILDED